jgi:hypothetical protein
MNLSTQSLTSLWSRLQNSSSIPYGLSFCNVQLQSKIAMSFIAQMSLNHLQKDTILTPFSSSYTHVELKNPNLLWWKWHSLGVWCTSPF